jgi:malate dehydrogenase (quinone)
MLDVLEKIYPDDFANWQPQIRKLVPSFGVDLNADAKLASASLQATAKALKLKA